jgi:hypothetical protein
MRQMAESFINDFLKLITGKGGTTSQGAGSAPGWTGILTSIVGWIGGLFGGGGGGSVMPSGGSLTGYSGMNWGGGADYSAFGYHSGKGPGELPSFYRLIPRFHTGVGPDEMLSIIRKNESVLTPAQMKALTPAQAQGFTLNMPISVNAPIDPRKAERLRDETERFVINKLKEYSR